MSAAASLLLLRHARWAGHHARAPRPQVLDALVDRLTDPEEKVRQAAVTAICDAAVADLQVRSARCDRPRAAPGSALALEAPTPA
jgi:phage terminase large subunit-like protein